MDSEQIRQTIRENSAEIVRLHNRTHETSGSRGQSPQALADWQGACAQFQNKANSSVMDSRSQKRDLGQPFKVALVPDVADSPDGIRSVVGHEQRSVLAHGHAYRPSPYLVVSDGEAGQKVLVFTGGMAVL